MEEHHEAYFLWKRLGLRQAWCWHFDAHLDIGREGLSEARLAALAPCQDAGQAAEAGALGNCYLPWGGLHCGNYLYPAIQEGLVGRLTWVIPPHLPTGDLLRWTRRHLDGWFELSLASYASFRLDGGKVVGEALGIPIEVGPWEAFSPPTEAVLIDLDIDYFVTDEGTVWGQPEALSGELRSWSALATTVAYSVRGGYTPYELRHLADPFLPAPSAPGYQAQPIDRATALSRCHRHPEALAAFTDLGPEFWSESLYYQGHCHQKLGQHQQALDCWRQLADDPRLPQDGQAYLQGLCAEECLQLQRWQCAVEHAQRGRRLAPYDYRHPWHEAMATEHLGDPKAAIKLVRRALRLSDDTLFGLKVRLALVRLYRRQGQRELARAELARLAQLDVTGEMAAATITY